MHALLNAASAALTQNDDLALEALYAEARAQRQQGLSLSPDERSAFETALLVFGRQVLAARSNLVLRERLFAAHSFAYRNTLHAAGGTPWAR